MAFFGIDWAVFISLVLVSVLETMQCADLSRNLARSVARTLEAARGRLAPTVLAAGRDGTGPIASSDQPAP